MRLSGRADRGAGSRSRSVYDGWWRGSTAGVGPSQRLFALGVGCGRGLGEAGGVGLAHFEGEFAEVAVELHTEPGKAAFELVAAEARERVFERSEEHTSELQPR